MKDIKHKTLHDFRLEAWKDSKSKKPLFEKTWFAGLVLFLVCLVAMTIDNI